MRIYILLYLSLVALLPANGCHNAEASKRDANRITIEVEIPENSHRIFNEISVMDKDQIEYVPIAISDDASQWKTDKAKAVKRNVKWVTWSNKPLQIKYCLGWLPIVSPGDSIHISYDDGEYIFSGIGAKKLEVWARMMQMEQKVEKPTKYSLYITSLNDYLNWNKYVDNKLALQLPVFDSYREKMDPFEFDYLKNNIISSTEEHRIYAFTGLLRRTHKDTTLKISAADLSTLWDSIHNKTWDKWLRSLSVYYGSLDWLYNFNEMEVERRFGFNDANDSLDSKEKRAFLNYTISKQQYKGLLRERLMVYVLEKIAVKKIGIKDPVTQSMLKDYYSQAGFPEYKQWVKTLEEHAGKKIAKN